MTSTLPRILLLTDKRAWAFNTIAQAIKRNLESEFSFDILATEDNPVFDDRDYDVIHVFFETETMHRNFLTGHAKIVKSVYSHYWETWGLTAREFYDTYLYEAHAITVPNLKLFRSLSQIPPPVFLFSEGVDTQLFHPFTKKPSEELIVGWAGDVTRPIKRLDWLKEACAGLCQLRIAPGNLSEEEMVHFYNGVDVIACSSVAEGSPRPVLEAMACGAFPVSFDVGIVPEVVLGDANGIIVKEESIDGLRHALAWCVEHVSDVRAQRKENVEIIRSTRDWRSTVRHMADVYRFVL